MSKAVLIMDMPESCSMCKFLYEFQGIKKCQLMNVFNNGASRLSQSTFSEKRHEKCPLRELPERMEVCGTYNAAYYAKGGKMPSYKIGWNDCLDRILGELPEKGGASKRGNPAG